MEPTQQKMEACRGARHHSNPLSLSHMTSLTPPTTAKTQPCHNRGRDTAISQTSSVHITQEGWGEITEPLQSITAHCTALSSHQWHLGERLPGGGRRSGGRHGAVLNCGHRLVSWQRRERLRRHLCPQQKDRDVRELIRSKVGRR